MSKPCILLTNDDGIESHGLWALADAVQPLGDVFVVAPREQWSGAGRALPSRSSGVIHSHARKNAPHQIPAYAVEGTPAQSVLHALLELLPKKPDLVISGINAGENLGRGITISGTLGAALEAAAAGIPAIALSQEMSVDLHRANSSDIDYSVTARFGVRFAEKLLQGAGIFGDVAVLKVDVPCGANDLTPWVITRVSASNYYAAVRPNREDLQVPAEIPYELAFDQSVERDSDIFAVKVKRCVSVSPISLDLTARVERDALRRSLESIRNDPSSPDIDSEN